MAEVVIVKNAAEAGALVAEEIIELLDAKPDAVLGVATGSTPLPVYQALAERLGSRDVRRCRRSRLTSTSVSTQHIPRATVPLSPARWSNR